uniref:hypothetical protein n=1 Tax=Comamonas terrigena TaxID=32013 RepID=UPI0008314250|nr:hypothetical protein [Comamonas terrigena]
MGCRRPGPVAVQRGESLVLAGARITGKMQGRQVLNATVVSTTLPVQQGEGMGVSRFVMWL